MEKTEIHYCGKYFIKDIKENADLEELSRWYIEILSDVTMAKVDMSKPKLETLTEAQYKTRIHNYKRKVEFGEMFLESLNVRMDFLKSDYYLGYLEGKKYA
jgi:hypothetical protein